MVSERDVHDRLREAIGQLPRTTIEACAEEIGRLRSQIDYATAESRAAWSGEVNVVLLRLEERLFHAHALALRAANEAEAWIAAGSAGPPVTPSAPRGGVSAPPPQARRPIEERMADAVRALPPRTPGTRPPGGYGSMTTRARPGRSAAVKRTRPTRTRWSRGWGSLRRA